MTEAVRLLVFETNVMNEAKSKSLFYDHKG
jgi:hypothetical protein